MAICLRQIANLPMSDCQDSRRDHHARSERREVHNQRPPEVLRGNTECVENWKITDRRVRPRHAIEKRYGDSDRTHSARPRPSTYAMVRPWVGSCASPSPLGSIGTTGMLIPNLTVVREGATRIPVWYHNGSLIGFFSSVHILPTTGTIIVVLVNSNPRNDCADWLGQFLVESILDNPDKNDYVSLAIQSAASYDQMWTDFGGAFQET